MVPEPSPRFFSAGGTTSNGGVVPHPMGTLLVAFGWPRLPSLLFEGMFQAARWDFFGVLCHTGALLEAVRVTCCCRRQQRGQRCSNLYPLPILRLIPVPPQGEAGGATSPWDLARWDPNPEPLSPSCGSLLVSQVASTLINPRPGGVGAVFLPISAQGSAGRLEPWSEPWSVAAHQHVELLLGSSSLTTFTASCWLGAAWGGNSPLGSAPPHPPIPPGHPAACPGWRWSTRSDLWDGRKVWRGIWRLQGVSCGCAFGCTCGRGQHPAPPCAWGWCHEVPDAGTLGLLWQRGVSQGPQFGHILFWGCRGSVGCHCGLRCRVVLLWGCRGRVGCHKVPNLGASCFGIAVVVWGVTRSPNIGTPCYGSSRCLNVPGVGTCYTRDVCGCHKVPDAGTSCSRDDVAVCCHQGPQCSSVWCHQGPQCRDILIWGCCDSLWCHQ